MINWRTFSNLNIFQALHFKQGFLGIGITDETGAETLLSPAELIQLKDVLSVGVGTFYYVHDTLGTASNAGEGTRQDPKTTADAGYSLCAANDTCIALPGHSESITADSGLDMDTAGVTFRGIGYGARRPTFNHNGIDLNKDMKMAAASNRLFNILVICSDVANDQVMALEMTATDCEVAYCEFRDDGTSQPLNYITVGVTADAECDRCYIHHNKFRVTGSGTAVSAISVKFDYTALRIEYNDIYGDWDNAGIEFVTAANTQLDLRVIGNDVTNNQTGNFAIDIHSTSSGSTGWVIGNHVRTDAINTGLFAGGCAATNNWWSDGEGVMANLNMGTSIAMKSEVTLAQSEEEMFIVTGGPILVTGFLAVVTEEGGEAAATLIDDVTIEAGTSIFNDITAELEIDDLAAEIYSQIEFLPTGPVIVAPTGDITAHGLNVVLEAGALDIDGVNDANVLATVYLAYTSLGGYVTVAA